jgi:hypothetical protein
MTEFLLCKEILTKTKHNLIPAHVPVEHLNNNVLMSTALCSRPALHVQPIPCHKIVTSKSLGCQVSDRRIIGLCFMGHQRTLMQKVNPGGFMRRKLRSE